MSSAQVDRYRSTELYLRGHFDQKVRALKTSKAATVGNMTATVDFVSKRKVSASIPFAN